MNKRTLVLHRQDGTTRVVTRPMSNDDRPPPAAPAAKAVAYEATTVAPQDFKQAA